MNGIVEIGSLSLKIPGLSPDEAHHLGQETARLLAERVGGLPSGQRPRRLEALDLRLAVPPGAPPEQIAAQIVDAILARLSD